MKDKKNKVMKIIGIIFITLIAISSLALSYSLLLISGIETFYIIMSIIIIIYISTILIFCIIKNIKHNRFKRYLTSIIISLVFISVFSIGGYLIITVYSKINAFSKDTLTYKTALVSFKEYKNISDIKDAKIGIIDSEEDIELYVLPMEYIKNNKLENNNELVNYNSATDLMNALYNEEVDLIFINSNYKDLFYGFEEYSNLNEINVIDTYSKKYEKTEVETDISDSSNKALTEPFTILLLGIDSSSDGLDKNAAFNGDTIMLITFNPKTLNATMFSIPRDTYVKIACGNRQLQKINTSAYGGSNCVIKTVENMTGITINYYAKINFKGVVDLVNALGGIDVDVPYKFCEQNSNREFGTSAQYLESGFQTLDGEQALALARNRKTHSECPSEWNKDGVRNDFVRGQNQQLVVEGMLNKVKTVKSANKLLEILDAISKNIDTNLSTDQMLSFYDVIKTIISSGSTDIVNVQKTLLTGYDMYVNESGGLRYAFFNWKGSLDDIVEVMKTNLGTKKEVLIKKFDFSINNLFEQQVVGSGSYSETKVQVVPNFSSYSVESIKSWGSSNGISITFIDSKTSESITSNYSDYTFSYQSVAQKTLISKAENEIKIYMNKKASTIPSTSENTETPIETEPVNDETLTE